MTFLIWLLIVGIVAMISFCTGFILALKLDNGKIELFTVIKEDY